MIPGINTILAWACAALLAVSATLGWYLNNRVQALGAANANLKTATEALIGVAKERETAARVLAARNRVIASQARELAQARQGLQTALQGFPGWSEADVPTAIIEALPGRSGASNAKPK